MTTPESEVKELLDAERKRWDQAYKLGKKHEREHIIKQIRYYGITLRWSLDEIVTKLKEGMGKKHYADG